MLKKTEIEVDLESLTSVGNVVFAGHMNGVFARQRSDFEEYDNNPDVQVAIRVPRNTMTFTTSFFVGLFGPSVERLGAQGFREKYQFQGADFSDVVSEGIAEVESGPAHAT